MRKVCAFVAVVCAFGAGLTPGPAGAASKTEASKTEVSVAISCSTFSSATVTGGYRVRLSCTGARGFIDGYGSTLSDAQVEAALLAQLFASTGLECSGFSVATTTGGYRARLSCDDARGFIDGYGTNLTAAARNARFLAQLFANTGLECSGFSVATTTGGYRARLSCDDARGFIDGYGTTLSDAQVEAGLLAQMFANTGLECTGFSVATTSGGYRARLSCDDIAGFVDGVGTTLTAAAQNARLLASIA